MHLRDLITTGLGPRLLGGVAIVNGFIWLLLWLSGIAARWSAEGVSTVKTNMALCQVLAGAGLVLLAEKGEVRRRAGMVIAVVVLVTSGLTLSEHVFGYNFGIDQLLVSEPPGAVATASPNRMGPPGSSSLVLVGAGLLLLAFERARAAAWLGLCVCVINLIPAVGFLYGVTGFYSIPRLTGISWPTVVVLLSLGAGLILARPAQAPAAQLLRDDAGGILLRRVAPAVILIPLVLGYLRVQAEERGWYDTAAGTGSLVIIIVLGFLLILWRTAKVLSRAAEAKATAEAKVREQEERYRRLFNDDLTGDFISTPEGRILLCNPAFARMFEFASVEEAIGTNMLEFYADPGERKLLMERLKREGKIERFGVWRKRRSGAPIYILENIIGHLDGRGELYEVNGYAFDDTERKLGEEALRASEKRFATLVEQAPVGIFETDAEGNCIFVNGGWQALAGLSADQAAGKGWVEAIHPEDRERVVAEWQAAAAAEREFAGEYRFRTPEGEVFWVMARAKPMRDGSGTVVRHLGTLLDITQRKRVEEALRKQQRLHKSVTDNATLALFIMDDRQHCVFMNPAAVQLTGYTLEETQGRPLHDVVHHTRPDGRPYPLSECAIDRAFPENDREQGEEIFVHKDGHFYPVAFTASPLRTASGQTVGTIIEVQDITEPKRVEEALRWERKILQAVMDGARNSHLAYLDRDFNFVRVNEAYARSCGYTPERMIGKNHFALYPDAENEAIFARARDTGEPAEFHDKPFVFPDQPERGVTYWDWILDPVKDGAGKVVGLVFSLFETTARKRMEEALREERDFSAAVLETAGALVVVLDTSGRIQRFNRACAELTGYAEEEVLGRPVWFLVPPEDLLGVREEWNTLSKGSVKSQHENHWLGKDGSRRLIAWSNTVLAGANGEIQHVIGTGLDITERKRAEEALERIQARLTQGVRVARLGIFEHDHLTDVIELSPVMRELLGFEADEGVTIAAIIQKVVPEDREELAARIRRAHDPGGEGQFEVDYRVPAGPGRVRWVSARSKTYFSREGSERRAVRTIGAALDVTERKESEARLERLVAERTAKLQELVGELEHFSYTITHDMRAPLRAMQGFTEMLHESWGSWREQEAKAFLNRIRTSAARMDALITDALNYSRTVRQELALSPVDVGALLRGMLDSYPEFQPSKARIEIEGEIPLVMGNEAGLTQCFSNLLGNAVKFVKPGQKPEIRIWAEAPHSQPSTLNPQPQHWVRIWVEDKGVGVPESMLSRVFDMFSRGHQSYEGTGIGLALVRKVVERMGGRVGVKSVEGEGSRFWVELRPGDVRRAK